MEQYRKAIAAVVMATMIAIIPIVKAGPMSVISKVNIGIAFLSAVLVYLVPNIKAVPALKTIVAAVLAGVMFLVTVISADCPALTAIFSCVLVVNWIQCGVVTLKALGVYLIPNETQE